MSKITKKEFQEKYKLTDNELEKIEFILKTFKGRIVAIKDQEIQNKES